MKIETTKSFRRSLKGCGAERLAGVADAMRLAAATFGHPHLHTGRGIRELRPGLYECRAGIETRLLFVREAGALVFEFAGTHDEVGKYARHFNKN
jgi:hypothetical protein